MTRTSVAGIVRIELNVADLERSTTFYVQALGFSTAGPAPAGAGERRLALGAQEILLRQAPAAARPYPQPRHANDPWFQHFAIAVSDMEAAYAILSAHAHEPISRGGPQLLPPSTGSVTAYKFRDPDGHPLELSHIPGSAWMTGAGAPFRGVDHTALAVQDLEASVSFYRDLGFAEAGRFLNHGPEQDRLDGLDGVRLDIVVLQPPEGGPHIELLAYRLPKPVPDVSDVGLGDICATTTVLSAAPAIPPHADVSFSDPDGHRLAVLGRGA